jgi:DnaJ-domain-containing protein 1
VEGFIDRLADLLKTLFRDERSGGSARPAGSSRGTGFRDPDLQEAWQELDDFMRGGSRDSAHGADRQSAPSPDPVDESLRQDYANLEVPFGSDIETVKRSYKKLMLKYHPDKHGADPRQQTIALEITKKINESFERIRARHESGSRSS